MATGAGDVDPFGTGPFQSLLHALHLRSGGSAAAGRRAVLAVLVAWVPLLVLAQVQGLAVGTGTASFLQDFAAYARFLVAVPLLVLAEGPARTWFTRVLNHFTEARLIPDGQAANYTALLDSTRRLLGSKLVLLVIVVCAYALTLASGKAWVAHGAANWIVTGGDTGRQLSCAGWWRILVSQPLFMSLLLTWFWRLALWGRCMRRIAHMKVRIVASHPDKAGGLAFLGQSLRGFPLLAFAFGSAIAGTLGNLMIYDGRSTTALTPVVAGTVIFILLICVGPLLTFVLPMREVQDDAELSYGTLATSLGLRFEERWLARPGDVGPETLGVPDFSTTADLYSVAGHVVEMRPLPIEIKDFIPLLVATVLPFLPIILRQVSFADLLTVAKRMLM
jgi:hypothetical protein